MSDTTKLFSQTPTRIKQLAMPELKSSIGQSLRSSERELERANYDGQLLNLAAADTHRFPPPEWALEEFNRAASGADASKTYTPYAGDTGVRTCVAKNISTTFGLEVEYNNILLTPGTQAGLFTAICALVDHGDEVLLADPDYMMTERILHYCGAKVSHLPLHFDGTGFTRFDPDELKAAMQRRPALLIFTNPNNPTGAVHSSESIEQIAELSMAYNIPVLVDQLYCRLTYDNTTFNHLASIGDMKKRTISLFGPSKTESLSGYRLGVAVAPIEIVERMEDVLSVSAMRAPAYAQHILSRWLADDKLYVAQRIDDYAKLQDIAIQQFAATELIDVTPARGSAYMFPRCNVDISDQKLALILKTQAGLIVNPGFQFGPQGQGHFRLCFAQDETLWRDALGRIISTLTSLANKT
nr:aminotransferase class I/II-fold pyridoxal phosphate-dependent enzyme [uncultured Amphritea sp.]